MSDQIPENKSGNKQYVFSALFYNVVTYIGVLLSLTVFAVELFLFGIDYFSGGNNVYLGIITYTILPVFLIIGLILIPAGAMQKRARILKGRASPEPPRLFVDLTLPHHRNAVVVFVVGTTILLVMTGIGSYKAFQYTESVHFCGITCHKVMEPEYTTYLQSAHARVKCVECHIGPGADWYVRSKMSGARQVLATFRNTYSRPITSPVHNLRPSEDTCEHCHWPGKFYSSVELNRTYFPADMEDPTPWKLRMLMNVGRHESDNKGSGIHAHMYLDNDIFYVARDEEKQDIVWIKSVDKDGKETVYQSGDSPYQSAEPPPEMVRKMDCIDCHNRPTHIFRSPSTLVNRAMERGEIDADLPKIKARMMAALSGKYASTAEAEQKITESMRTDYREILKDEYPAREAALEKSIRAAVKLYSHNFFPVMNVRWDTHKDNIGHMVTPGCFRCHDDQHVSSSGKAITKDCTTCHTIIEQGPAGAEETSTRGLPFQHPFEDDGLWQDMNCFDCHTGN